MRGAVRLPLLILMMALVAVAAAGWQQEARYPGALVGVGAEAILTAVGQYDADYGTNVLGYTETLLVVEPTARVAVEAAQEAYASAVAQLEGAPDVLGSEDVQAAFAALHRATAAALLE